MSAAAARTERIGIGSLVLNVADRDPGTTAVAAATLPIAGPEPLPILGDYLQ